MTTEEYTVMIGYVQIVNNKIVPVLGQYNEWVRENPEEAQKQQLE